MDINELKRKAVDVRKGAIALVHKSKGHIGGTMSSADILTAILYKYANFTPENVQDLDRDRFILSKGHTSEAYIWALADKGFYSKEELDNFNCEGSTFLAHPSKENNGVEFSTGALGHGLSLACGIALGAKKRNSPSKCFVLMGDGETDEGSVWEAAMFASSYKLDNLCVVVDRNHFQISGDTESVMKLEPYADKWKAFGFDVKEIDGNDMEQIVNTFDGIFNSDGRPKLVIANTLKGKGVSFMEGNVVWHHGHLSDEQYEIAVSDLEKIRKELEA